MKLFLALMSLWQLVTACKRLNEDFGYYKNFAFVGTNRSNSRAAKKSGLPAIVLGCS